ncbi:MAG: hypothetical protein N3C12_15870 [Candidatus Binatia bacterium]|nr:hypothetical protein [Candidatus Binatia bacterium]
MTPTATELPTATPTPTVLIGPIVTAIGVADLGGQVNQAIGVDAEGRPIFSRTEEAGFILFVEARPGRSQLPVGTVIFNPKRGDPTAQPDLQVQVNRALGDGSEAVCDATYPRVGGVPGTLLGMFDTVQSVTDALNDLGCRFRVFSEADFACTQDRGANLVYADSSSTVQFCILVNDALTFPPGDTIVTARLRDIGGNVGAPAQIVVRVP